MAFKLTLQCKHLDRVKIIDCLVASRYVNKLVKLPIANPARVIKKTCICGESSEKILFCIIAIKV